MSLGDHTGFGTAEVEDSVGARRSPAPAAAGGLEIPHADPGVPIEGPAHVGRCGAGDRVGQPAVHHIVFDEPLYGGEHGLELSSAQQVERALAGEVAVAAVQPDLDALGLVDVAQALDEVVQLEQVVAVLALRPVAPRRPVLDLTAVYAGNRGQLVRRDRGLAQVIDDAGVDLAPLALQASRSAAAINTSWFFARNFSPFFV